MYKTVYLNKVYVRQRRKRALLAHLRHFHKKWIITIKE